MSTVRRYPLIVFFVLAYAFSWRLWALYSLGLSPSPIIEFGPSSPPSLCSHSPVATLVWWRYCAE
jgi:hypothetical protein